MRSYEVASRPRSDGPMCQAWCYVHHAGSFPSEAAAREWIANHIAKGCGATWQYQVVGPSGDRIGRAYPARRSA